MALNNFDEFIDKTDFLQTRLLQVNSCGSERVVKYDYTILRSNGRRDYHFLYLQNGWLDIEVGTAKARLTRGQCAVFLPNVRQMYSFTAAFYRAGRNRGHAVSAPDTEHDLYHF